MNDLIRKLIKGFNNKSLRLKLIVIYVFTIIVPMLVMNYISYKNSTNLIRTEIVHTLVNITEQINNNIESKLKQVNNLSSLLFSSTLLGDILNKSRYSDSGSDMLQDDREFEKFFTYIINQSNDIESIYIFTSNHNIFYKSYAGQMKIDYDPTQEVWYKEAIDKKGKIAFYGLHTPWPLIRSSSKVFSMVRQIRSMDGQALGVILIDIKPDWLNRIIKESINSYNSKFTIFDNSQNTIYNDIEYSTVNKQNLQTINNLTSSNSNTSTGIMNGEKAFLAYGVSAISDWKIISMTPEKVIKERTGRFLASNVGIAAASIIVYSLLIVLLYLTIYKPIRRLILSMKKVQSGDFKVTVKQDSTDEIGQLCHNFNTMIGKINELIESEYKATILRKDAEFKALQLQMNPHFLYNTLQSISSIAVVKKVPEINEVSKSLGYMLRYCIKTKGDFVPFEQELEHVKSYIAIQKIRMEDRIFVDMQLEEQVYGYGIMKLTIQPFVENAFNHGISKKRTKGIIEIGSKIENENIVLIIKDNGIGIGEEKLNNLKHLLESIDLQSMPSNNEPSIGIQNVNSRLKLFYGSSYTLDIESSPGYGTQVTIRVPAIKLENR